MRHNTASRRPRNRNHSQGSSSSSNNGGGNRRSPQNRNQIFDSNGPDVRIRGTAHQVCEKYLALAKDAQAVGDIVQAENYLQHAEHYQRIIGTWNEDFRDVTRPAPSFGDQPEQQEGRSEDDLALPISILGGEVKLKESQDVRSDAYENAEELEAV